MDAPTRAPISTRPLFSGGGLTPEERARKFREFVAFVVDNYERSGHPLPADHPLRDSLVTADAA